MLDLYIELFLSTAVLFFNKVRRRCRNWNRASHRSIQFGFAEAKPLVSRGNGKRKFPTLKCLQQSLIEIQTKPLNQALLGLPTAICSFTCLELFLKDTIKLNMFLIIFRNVFNIFKKNCSIFKKIGKYILQMYHCRRFSI